MQKGATLDGARSLFATILSPEVNGHIAEQLPAIAWQHGWYQSVESARGGNCSNAHSIGASMD